MQQFVPLSRPRQPRRVGLGVCFCTLIFGLLRLGAAAPGAKPVELAVQAAEVKRIRAGLAAVLRQGALPADLAAEARTAEAAGSAEEAVRGYGIFVRHLEQRQASLLRGGGSSQQSQTEDKAKEMLPKLESNAQRLVRHILADNSPRHADERAVVVKGLQEALAFEKPGGNSTSAKASGSVTDRVLRLHNAIVAAHDLVAKRSEELGEEEEKLKQDIEDQQAKVLYAMLKQRKSLPVPTQVAMLRRPQFANFSYAQQLLRSHRDDGPLYQQLLSILPQDEATRLTANTTSPKDHLAVHGSEGRVHVISSHMKNVVQNMVGVLTTARDKLQVLVNKQPSSIPSAEATKGQEIVSELNKVLGAVGKTHDLQTQLNAMDEVEKKLAVWMSSASGK